MGTALAPSYANLFMTELEEGMLSQSKSKPALWVHYIDDIFFIWRDGEERW